MSCRINILTYGTFDLLHKGHENIIEKAIKLSNGGKVVVGVSSDKWNNIKGKKAYENEQIRVNNIKEKYKNTNLVVVLEDHDDHMKQWLEDYDKYDINFILMGGDHLNFLCILDGKLTPKGREVRILFTNRTPNISSTMLRKKLFEENKKNNEKRDKIIQNNKKI